MTSDRAHQPRGRRSKKEDPKPPTASALVLDGLREAILSGEYAPGSRIGQEAIGDRYGVSRVPVREALRELESEGLVTLVPHSGARVARFDMAECVEIYKMREALEPLLLEDAVLCLDEESLESIRTLSRQIAANAGNVPGWLALDREFHLASLRRTQMQRGLEIIQRLWNQTQHFRRAHITNLDPEQLERLHMEHWLLVDALERRDPEDAAERLRLHIRRTRTTLMRLAETDPNLIDSDAVHDLRQTSSGESMG